MGILEQVKPEAVGLSSERLGQYQLVASAGGIERFAGCSALVGRRGKVAFFEATGIADKELGNPFTAPIQSPESIP